MCIRDRPLSRLSQNQCFEKSSGRDIGSLFECLCIRFGFSERRDRIEGLTQKSGWFHCPSLSGAETDKGTTLRCASSERLSDAGHCVYIQDVYKRQWFKG